MVVDPTVFPSNRQFDLLPRLLRLFCFLDLHGFLSLHTQKLTHVDDQYGLNRLGHQIRSALRPFEQVQMHVYVLLWVGEFPKALMERCQRA